MIHKDNISCLEYIGLYRLYLYRPLLHVYHLIILRTKMYSLCKE